MYDGGPQLRSHQVRTLDVRVDILRRMVWQGDQAFNKRNPPIGGLKDPRMRQIGLEVTSACRARADMCELAAIYEFVARNVRYTGDITDKDTYQTAWRTLQYGGGDCLPHDTLLFVIRGVSNSALRVPATPELVPIRDVRVGDSVMESGRWVPVTQHWFTGRKQILAFDLSNGTVLRCSPEHRLFRLDATEARAARIEVGEHLLTPREPIRFHSDEIPVSPDGVRVTAIRAEKRPALCFDITTESGRFWLPESDALVHNCDDHSVLCAVLAMENGFPTRFRITSNTGATWDHIYCLAGVPRTGPRKWVPLDTTLPGANRFGVHPPMAKYRDFEVVEP